MATAISMQPIPEMVFEEHMVDPTSADIALFNVSPLPSSTRATPRMMGLKSAYYSASPMTNKRSERILLRKKQQEKLKEEQMEQQKQVRFAKPVAIVKTDSVASRSAKGRLNRDHTHPPLNSTRRDEFIAKRKIMIAEQIKQQLALSSGDPSEIRKMHQDTVDSFQGDVPDIPTIETTEAPDLATATTGQNLELPEGLQRPGLSRRRSTLIRSSSFAVRNANSITRKAVGIMNDAMELGRKERRKCLAPPRLKSAKEQNEEKKQLVRKYSMLWISKTAQRKRMDYMKTNEDFESYSVSMRSSIHTESLQSTPIFIFSHSIVRLLWIINIQCFNNYANMYIKKYKFLISLCILICLQPYKKFRRAARLIKSLIQVCRVCQE